MTPTLYRAQAWPRQQPAAFIHVFFECMPHQLGEPDDVLLSALSAVWQIPASEIHAEHYFAEADLLGRQAQGSAVTADARLFEIGKGDGGRICYCTPGRTLLLVRPATLQRLAKGLQAADQLASTGYTVLNGEAAPSAYDPTAWLPRRVSETRAIYVHGALLDLASLPVAHGQMVNVRPVPEANGFDLRYQFNGAERTERVYAQDMPAFSFRAAA